MRYRVFKGIRFKLAAIIFLLVAVTTTASAIIVMNIMDRFIEEELIRKGVAIGRSAATIAGYNILSGDSLALDNLTAKFKEIQEDMLFMAVVDHRGRIRAHSTLGQAGMPFQEVRGRVIRTIKEGSTVTKARRAGEPSYEFRVPIYFSGKRLGDIYLALDAGVLVASQRAARVKILLISILILAFGVLGVLYLSEVFTTPIKKLSEGVNLLSADRYGKEIQVVSEDELGELTRNFNVMAKTITQQKSELRQNAMEIEAAYVDTVRLLAAAVDARDGYTLGHSTRVGQLSISLGEKMGLDEETLKDMEIACMFHDVGKIRTPDSILNKKSRLTSEEFRLMMLHTVDGAEILKMVDSLHKHIPVALYHHEWYDGSGYPTGIKGGEIPLQAAIISIADAYDAMTSGRPYRDAMSTEDALRELERFRGRQFAPHITDHFIEMFSLYNGNIPAKSFLEGTVG